MAEQIMIAGTLFRVPVRYEEGHELTANEASALNQTYHENLRNNFASKVKDTADGRDLTDNEKSTLQAELDKYAAEYEFGVRTGGGFRGDPVLTEAMRIAKEKIFEHIRKKGAKKKDIPAEVLTKKAKEVLEKNPEIMELARSRVEEIRMASTDIDTVLADL